MAYEQANPIVSNEFAPTLGETTAGLAEGLVKKGTLPDVAAFEPVRQDALAIVKNCWPFHGPDGSKTGLVIGYVQSGKTVSMEAVSAIASDSGCRIVILLAGVTTNLLNQNATRFTQDLRAAAGNRVWKIFNSQSGFAAAQQGLRQAVEEWKDKNVSEDDQQTILLLVLKHHAHLERLRELLSKLDLRRIPAIVLDDEADQAGLNTSVRKGEESTTYSQIGRIRRCLPHHTYLQYTATPQAPLLIALDDMLSPAFAELVRPGKGYTGGQTFFGNGATDLVKTIPDVDLFKPGSPPDEPPESLLDALRVFFVGCAIAALRNGPIPRSMLVHPSPRKNDHRVYLTWIQEVINRWSVSLASTNAADRREAIEEFEDAYSELVKTDSCLPTLEELSTKLLFGIRRVSLKEVNSEDGSEIDWNNGAEHILVGGEKLNRGFTVEGLMVSYMPRDAGDWNADTIQQRARFFGYKQKYLALCRLYLHPDVIHAFRAYVRHEEDVRSQLAEHRGKPLREWRRAFFMDAKMRPTRRNVLADPYFRVKVDTPWFVQEEPHSDEEAAGRNRTSLSTLREHVTFHPEKGFFEHLVAEIDLATVFRDYLLSYEVRGGDVPGWYGQLVTLRDVLESDPSARVVLVAMAGPRERSLVNGDEVKLHQGRSSAIGEDKYPGDAKMADGALVTIQIHTLKVKYSSERYLDNVTALAIHIPKELRKDDVVAKE